MPDVNEEMRLTADYAISSAKERYGLILDYSEESLAALDTILDKIYWGFSSRSREEGEGGLVYNTAMIWGSYLGEYMRLKWGGTWIQKGTERRVSITTIEFSPISFIFQRITKHPEYRVQNYIQETKNVVYTSVIHPKESQYVSESVPQPAIATELKVAPKKINLNIRRIDKRLIYWTGGVLGLLIVILGGLVGYVILSNGAFPALGVDGNTTSTSTAAILPTNMPSPTLDDTSTDIPTVTQLPTYTPQPTRTPRPSSTPYMSPTPLPSWTPTETETPMPTDTEVPYRSPTPSKTPTTKPPENTRAPTATLKPSATNTEPPPPPPPPPPPSVVSCGVNPSTIDPVTSVTLTFSVQFSTAGNFDLTGINFSPNLGASGCSASSGGGASASCQGSSGLLPPDTSVDVTINTSIGNCQTGYHTP
jgi:hypothetical protein